MLPGVLLRVSVGVKKVAVAVKLAVGVLEGVAVKVGVGVPVGVAVCEPTEQPLTPQGSWPVLGSIVV